MTCVRWIVVRHRCGWLWRGRRLREKIYMESPAQETVIRVAERGDSKGILRCLAAAFEPYRMQYSAEAFSDTTLNADTLAERMRHMHILVATFNGEVVGTVSASCNEEEGHLR